MGKKEGGGIWGLVATILVAAVRADHDPDKLFRCLELHAIVYPSRQGFGKGHRRTFMKVKKRQP